MIEYELRDKTAWITLNRPEKMNAVHLDGWKTLRELVERGGREGSSVVLTGVEDAFCAGNDVNSLQEDDEVDIDTSLRRIHDIFETIETVEVPVIAAVNGTAYGGGCELAAASDLAVAEEGVKFALPETRLGALPAYSIERVAAIAGRKRMMELILTGEPIDAATAAEWGLINRTVEQGRLTTAVEEYCNSIQEADAQALKVAKRTVNDRFRSTDEFQRMVGLSAYLRHSSNREEAVESFLGE